MSTVERVRARDFVEGITVLACHNCHNYAHARGLKKKEKKTQDLFFGVIMYRKFAICLGFGSSLVVRLVSGTLSRFHYIAKL